MAPDTMSLRALGRATLARQMLLERARVAPITAIERLAGVQAQLGRPAFIALWSRLAGFRREPLLAAIAKRRVVRATLMRGTLHMVSARDYLAFRPAMAAMLAEAMRRVLRDRADGLDVAALTRAARTILADGPLTFEQMRPRLAAALGHADERALGLAVRMVLPLVQASDGSAWGWATGGAFALAESWLERPIADVTPADRMVLRYLAALGPASVADAQTWSGLPRLREVLDRLRPKLRVFRDPGGRELFDLPKAPRPDEDVPAPIRFLPDWDNATLSHADRSRVIDDAHRRAISTPNLMVMATFLIDGRVAGRWKIERARKAATLAMDPFKRLAPAVRRALEAEGDALLEFVEPDAATRQVVVKSL